ncbi:MAG: flagellar export protein FliJ [Spirochaetales bacterium]|nr:flagellar export protein FliJ [Spirochaetales bacterium]
MKRFQFRLEKLLKIRQYREREWELKLADITGQCLVLEKKIVISKDNISHTLDERSALGGTIDIYDLIANEMYIARMKQAIVNAGIELEQKKREREKVRKKFLEASKQKKILEKLKQRKEQEYYKEAKKEEFKNVDEINAGDAIRKLV